MAKGKLYLLDPKNINKKINDRQSQQNLYEKIKNIKSEGDSKVEEFFDEQQMCK